MKNKIKENTLSNILHHFEEKKFPSTGDAEKQLDFVCWVPKERWTENRDRKNIC